MKGPLLLSLLSFYYYISCIFLLKTSPSLPFVGCFQVNYLSFNPYNEWILATASSDTTIGLFDMRKLTVPLHVLSSHTYALYALAPPLFVQINYIIIIYVLSCLCVFLLICAQSRILLPSFGYHSTSLAPCSVRSIV